MGDVTKVLVGVATVSIKFPIGGTYEEVGFTEDGVDFEYAPEHNDIEVEERTFPISRVLTKEVAAIIVNMAQSELKNINWAAAGGTLAGSTITFGDGTLKEMSVKAVGTDPDGDDRTIEAPLCTPVGTVGMPFKKGEKTVVPARFEVLHGTADPLTIVDS